LRSIDRTTHKNTEENRKILLGRKNKYEILGFHGDEDRIDGRQR
jgi:hypothetical protein